MKNEIKVGQNFRSGRNQIHVDIKKSKKENLNASDRPKKENK